MRQYLSYKASKPGFWCIQIELPMPQLVKSLMLLCQGVIYLHPSRALFIQLHPLQPHILCFLQGIQFSGIVTLPIIRFSAQWPSYAANPLVQLLLQLRWCSHPVGPTEMGIAWVGHSSTPKWVNDARPPGSSTSPRSVKQNITRWCSCQGHQKEHWSGRVPLEWEECGGCAWATERGAFHDGEDAGGQG